MRIEKLFEQGRITAHQRKELLKQFTGQEAVALALSNPAANTSFETTLRILEANQPGRISVSGAQVLPNLLLNNAKEGDADPETKSAIEYMHQQVGMRK